MFIIKNCFVVGSAMELNTNFCEVVCCEFNPFSQFFVRIAEVGLEYCRVKFFKYNQRASFTFTTTLTKPLTNPWFSPI